MVPRVSCEREHCGLQIAPADRRWPLLEQAKVVINLHGGESTRIEWRSVLDAIHAGAVIVTEHSSGLAPFVAGEHFLVASGDAIPFVAESLVRDPERLAALRTAAYERLSRWLPFATSGGRATSCDCRTGGGAGLAGRHARDPAFSVALEDEVAAVGAVVGVVVGVVGVGVGPGARAGARGWGGRWWWRRPGLPGGAQAGVGDDDGALVLVAGAQAVVDEG